MERTEKTNKDIFKNMFFMIVFFVPSITLASTSVGTIDPTNSPTSCMSGNQCTKICQNDICSDFGNANWKPTTTKGALPVTITDTSITGHVWGDEIGWINLAPTGAGIFVNPNTGVITGKAFASSGSWINFNTTGQSVTLVDNGNGSNFLGWAWVSGANGGWMRFDCSGVGTCIKTDWRTTPNRVIVSSGGGGVLIPPPIQSPSDLCPNISGKQSAVPSGYALINGSCVFQQTDVCLNIPGNQTIIPVGYLASATNICTPQQVDVCPNVPGVQTSIVNCLQPQNPNNNQNNINSNNNQNSQNPTNQNPLNSQKNQLAQNSNPQEGEIIAENTDEPTFDPPQVNIIEGEYKEVFPSYSDSTQTKRPCTFCVLHRYDSVEKKVQVPNQNINIPKTFITEVKKREIIKYGFVSKRFEMRIPLSRDKDSQKDIDATSITITSIAGWGLWKLILVRGIKFLFTKS